MGSKHSAWALTKRVGSPAVKLVLLILADRADDEGMVSFTPEDLEEATELRLSQVNGAVATLRTREILETDGSSWRIAMPANAEGATQ